MLRIPNRYLLGWPDHEEGLAAGGVAGFGEEEGLRVTGEVRKLS